MLTRDQIVAEARTWIDTPFHHQGRLKGVGVDCVGVIVEVAHALGISSYDTLDYAPNPNPQAMRAELEAHLDRIDFAAAQPGDILWFRIELDPQHLGILTVAGSEPWMVHAFHRRGVDRVIEQRVPDWWRRRVVGCYRYRGVA